MAAPAGEWHYPRRRHVRICPEQSWGELPAQPDWRTVPLFGDGCRLAAEARLWSPQGRFGGWRRNLLLPEQTVVAGRLSAMACPQVCGRLMEMALDRGTEGQVASYCLDHYSPADPRRNSGVMAEGLRIEAGPEARRLVLRLPLLARRQEGLPGLEEADFPYADADPVPFSFEGATLTLDGAAATGVEAFSLEVRNHLTAGPNRGGEVAFLSAGRRDVALRLEKLADGRAGAAAVRDGASLAFEATFRHPLGHTLSLALPRLVPERSEERVEPGNLVRAGLALRGETDASGCDITWSVKLQT